MIAKAVHKANARIRLPIMEDLMRVVAFACTLNVVEGLAWVGLAYYIAHKAGWLT